MADVRRVVHIAIFSRLVALVLQVVFDALISDYDSSSSLQVSENGVLDWLLSRTFGGFTNWDSVYFLKIAEEGYLYEQYMAFFPLYPMMIRLISDALIRIPIFGENQRTLLLLCGWIISNSSFVASAVALYKLSIVILRKKNLAFVVSVLFCFNPATVFMASLYTESTFACLEFSALFFMETDGAGNLFLASVLFGLGSATRSNGILACGFISHAILRALFADLNSKRNHTSTQNISETVCLLATTLLKLLTFNTTVLAPSIGYQMYGYFAYCSQSLGRVHSSTQVSPWCKNTIPLSYTFIQKHYWDVGFLKYFEVKQIPNFLLASPMVVLCFSAVMSYFDKKENFAALKTLGLKLNINKKEEELKKHCEKVSAYHNPRLFVYIVHLGFVTVLGVTSMHVQVVTRFIASSSPVIYWYCAHVISQRLETRPTAHRSSKMASSLVVGYFLLYCVLGIALHSNFYPWT